MSEFEIQFIPEDVVDGYAIQALAEGIATEDQQKRAFHCIVYELCNTYKMTFHPESQKIQDLKEGRRSVGLALVGLLSLNLGEVQKRGQEKQKQPDTPVKINRKRGK